MIPVLEAIRIVLDVTRPLAPEFVPLEEALGRVLAEDARADTDLPPFNRAQMDGYAVRAADLRETPARLRLVGEAAAGRGFTGELSHGEAVRIMTGAPLPAGADSVQQVEVTREVDGGEFVIIERATTPGQFVVPRGSEVRAGTIVLRAGDTVTAPRAAVLAAFGYARVLVRRQPRVAVLATGTELVSVGARPGPEEIRDSNTYSLAAYAERAGASVRRLPLAGDDPDALRATIAAAAEAADVVVLSGGVSMGRYDFTKPALHALGARVHFERVALRPGKPTVFAELPGDRQVLAFGLPGNPVSVSVTFNLFARTALRAMQGDAHPTLAVETAVLVRATKGAPERASYLPAELWTDDDGRLLAAPLKWGGSSDFVAFARAAALLVVPQGVKALEAGETTRIVRLPE
jgi:molybdopterin molybdotransferase